MAFDINEVVYDINSPGKLLERAIESLSNEAERNELSNLLADLVSSIDDMNESIIDEKNDLKLALDDSRERTENLADRVDELSFLALQLARGERDDKPVVIGWIESMSDDLMNDLFDVVETPS